MAFAKAHGKLSELSSFKEPDISHTHVFKLIKPPHPLTASIPPQYGCENVVEKRKPKKRLAKIELLFRICLFLLSAFGIGISISTAVRMFQYTVEQHTVCSPETR